MGCMLCVWGVYNLGGVVYVIPRAKCNRRARKLEKQPKDKIRKI